MSHPEFSAPAQRTLSCVGLHWRAATSIKSTLALLGGRTRETWLYSEEPDADVVIYSPDDPLALAMARHQRNARRRQLFVPAGGHAGEDEVMPLRFPVGARRLVDCLDRASSMLEGLVGPGPDTDAPSLCQQWDDAIRAPGTVAVALRCGADSGVYLIESREWHWPRTLTVEAQADLLSQDWDLQAVPLHRLADVQQSIEAAGSHSRADALLWAVAARRSKGQLLQRIDPRKRYRLRRAPDHDGLAHHGAEAACSALLMQRGLTPLELAEASGVPMSVVSPFLNACALTGLLYEANEAKRPSSAGIAMAPLHAPVVIAAMLRRLRSSFATS